MYIVNNKSLWLFLNDVYQNYETTSIDLINRFVQLENITFVHEENIKEYINILKGK